MVHVICDIDYGGQTFSSLQFKKIPLKNIMIFISYLTPIADMASSFKFWDATPSPSFDWEMVICGSKSSKYCSK